MDREPNETIDLIDLGVASAETQGAEFGDEDYVGEILKSGLSDD